MTNARKKEKFFLEKFCDELGRLSHDHQHTFVD